MSADQHQTYLIIWRSFAYGVLLVMFVFIGFGESASNQTGEPTIKPDCSVERSCNACKAFGNCAWCFAKPTFCIAKNLKDTVVCDEDDWDYGDCDKKEKEAVLLYVLLACAVILLLIVVLLVLYIFFCKMPRNNVDYSPLNTADVNKRRSRTPLMSKKFKPVGSRTDELKKKYGLQ